MLKHQKEIIFFLNTDTTLLPDCLLNLDEGIHLFPDYGMYAPKMIYPNGKINSTGLCISLSGAAWDRGLGEKDIGQYDKPDEIFGPCGGAAVFKREPFWKLMDLTRVFLYGRCRYHYSNAISGMEMPVSSSFNSSPSPWGYYGRGFRFFCLLWKPQYYLEYL